jgi:hypothetical protein
MILVSFWAITVQWLTVSVFPQFSRGAAQYGGCAIVASSERNEPVKQQQDNDVRIASASS